MQHFPRTFGQLQHKEPRTTINEARSHLDERLYLYWEAYKTHKLSFPLFTLSLSLSFLFLPRSSFLLPLTLSVLRLHASLGSVEVWATRR